MRMELRVVCRCRQTMNSSLPSMHCIASPLQEMNMSLAWQTPEVDCSKFSWHYVNAKRSPEPELFKA